MARITDQEIERHLANKFEGRVFVEIHLAKINGNEFRINKDFYTVKKGKVYGSPKVGQPPMIKDLESLIK